MRESARVWKMRAAGGLDQQSNSSGNSNPRMAYRVEITPRAERDLTSIYIEINAFDSESAHDWYRGLAAAILSLSKMPNRNPVTPENKKLRHLLYGSKPYIYRVIFRVLSKRTIVQVLHLRHGSRQRFRKSDLGQP